MKKKILGIFLIITMVSIAGYHVYMNQSDTSMSELTLVNIEALAQNDIDLNKPGNLEIACNGYSVVIECKWYCTQCGRKWVPSQYSGGYSWGNCIGIRGTCLCGTKYQKS